MKDPPELGWQLSSTRVPGALPEAKEEAKTAQRYEQYHCRAEVNPGADRSSDDHLKRTRSNAGAAHFPQGCHLALRQHPFLTSAPIKEP